jgi:hypothetical protein
MIRIKLVAGVVAFVFVAGGIVSLSPTVQVSEAPATTAAKCAGFSPRIAVQLGGEYRRDRALYLSEVSATYQIQRVIVYDQGGCLAVPETIQFPVLPPNTTLEIGPAIGYLSPEADPLPFYVLWEQSALPDGSGRVFWVLRLPRSALFVQPDPKAGPKRTV